MPVASLRPAGPVVQVGTVPVFERWGALWVTWAPSDYADFCAVRKGWTTQQTMAQPLGLLHRMIAAELTHDDEIRKLNRLRGGD